MPGSCSVTCSVINTTDYNLTLNNYSPPYKGNGDNQHQNHGEFNAAPLYSIPCDGGAHEAFSIQKADGLDGSTGWVSYLLESGSQDQLILMFNNPHSSSGQNSNDNCWFYAVIQGADGAASGGNVSVCAAVSGTSFNSGNAPTVEDTMSYTVTISKY